MKISELIAKLEKIKQEHGDLYCRVEHTYENEAVELERVLVSGEMNEDGEEGEEQFCWIQYD